VNDAGCFNGLGVNNTCTVASLGGETVNLFGLAFDGDVDGNDKVHLGLRCDEALADATTVPAVCPPGQLMNGRLADGTLMCASPAPEATDAFRTRCTSYLGWSDNCDGCTNAPQKWGTFREGGCQNGVGGDSTCAAVTLGGEAVSLFGMNTDGDVNDDDKFYLGMLCQ
jgi:hypothetical protein